MKNLVKNPFTTITGSVLLILSGLTLYGVISQSEAASLSEYSVIIINAIAGIVALFAKDSGGGI